MDAKSLQSGENEDQSDAQLEHRLQAKREREVDVGEDTDRPGTPTATSVQMQVEGRSDFLQSPVSQEWSLANSPTLTTMRLTMTLATARLARPPG